MATIHWLINSAPVKHEFIITGVQTVGVLGVIMTATSSYKARAQPLTTDNTAATITAFRMELYNSTLTLLACKNTTLHYNAFRPLIRFIGTK